MQGTELPCELTHNSDCQRKSAKSREKIKNSELTVEAEEGTSRIHTEIGHLDTTRLTDLTSYSYL